MALIRAEYAVDYREKATTLNLADIASDAQKIKRDAETQAKAIIDAANNERDKLINGASEEGHRQGFEKGHAEGVEQGKVAGQEAAEEEWHTKIMALAAAWGDALTSLEQQRRAVIHNIEADALRLVADIATRVAKRSVELQHSHTAAESLSEAITRIDTATRVTIEINPSDLESTQRGMGAIADQLLGSPDLRIRSNDSIAPGSVIVESDAARIDASINHAISKLIEAILPNEEALESRLEQPPQDDPNAKTQTQPETNEQADLAHADLAHQDSKQPPSQPSIETESNSDTEPDSDLDTESDSQPDDQSKQEDNA